MVTYERQVFEEIESIILMQHYKDVNHKDMYVSQVLNKMQTRFRNLIFSDIRIFV